jgi:excisionase family DNA binding protein
MIQKEFYTVEEFSDKIRVHPNTVRNGIKAGRIQAFRAGPGSRSSYRISSTEVDRLCELDMSKLIEEIVERKLEERK